MKPLSLDGFNFSIPTRDLYRYSIALIFAAFSSEAVWAQSNSDSPNALICQWSPNSSDNLSTTLGGSNATATNRKEALACGIQNNVRPATGQQGLDGEGNMAFGMYNNVTAFGQATVFGYENTVGGIRNVVVGINNSTGAARVGTDTKSATIIGINNESYAERETVLIGSANTVGEGSSNSIAVGNNIWLVGQGAIAIGERAAVGDDYVRGAPTSSADGAIAIGGFSQARLANSVALGSRSVSREVHTGAYSVNGGSIAATSAPGSVFSVGDAGFERQVQNVAAGVVSATSTDAVNGSQLYAVGTQVNQNSAFISSLTDEVFDLRNLVGENAADIDGLRDQAFAGVALALSMGGATLPPGKNSAISIGMGTYKNQEAFSASATFLLNPNMVLTGGLGVTGNGKDVGTRVGMTLGW